MHNVTYDLQQCRDCNIIAIRLRYDYDPTTTYRVRLLPFHAIRCEQKMNMSIFRRSRVVVLSQSNRNCDIGLRAYTVYVVEYIQLFCCMVPIQ